MLSNTAIDFLRQSGWDGYDVSSLKGDAGRRQYFRISKKGQSAIFVQADEVQNFVRLAEYLRSKDLKIPEIYKADENQNYLLIEDLGDTILRNRITESDSKTCYRLATNVLIYMKDNISDNDPGLPSYKNSLVDRGKDKIVRWYLPACGVSTTDTDVDAFNRLWDEIEKNLPACPQGFLHIDYHPDNLMWCPDEQGLKRCGILDFQDAMWGPLAYDLVNLLKDARADVSKGIQTEMLEHYCTGMSGEDQEAFHVWFDILALQFHCRVIGQFIELERQGKEGYLMHIPRLQGYIRQAFQNPLFDPVRQWFQHFGSALETPVPDLEKTIETWNIKAHETGT